MKSFFFSTNLYINQFFFHSFPSAFHSDDMMSGKHLKRSLRKYRKVGSRVVKHTIPDHISKLEMWVSFHRSDLSIPKDVPKGHLVVYVGEEECKRFVIKVKLLSHPLFQALLDHAEQVFQFPKSSSKLCIPCKEHVFLSVLQVIASERVQRCCQIGFL